MTKRITAWVLLLSFTQALCAIDADSIRAYYKNIDGLTGEALKTALYQLISPHTVYGYGQLKAIYETTDVVPGTEDQVYDLFSADVNYYEEGKVFTSGKVNREHVVPQSWWGKGSSYNIYSDLYNVRPSESKANSAKSNYPPGKVGKASFDNGRIRVGTAVSGGTCAYAFEPYDEWKGDFARIYLYDAVCYQNVPWTYDYLYVKGGSAYPTLQSWAIPVLLEWNAKDSICAFEADRNDHVQVYQGNRNPFVDFPQLADYIWGDKKGTPFNVKTEPIHNVSASSLESVVTDIGTETPFSYTLAGQKLDKISTGRGIFFNNRGKKILIQ